jgi:hypothetical protein
MQLSGHRVLRLLRGQIDLTHYRPNLPPADLVSPDKEPLIEGVVAVKKYEWRGVEFDWAEMLRKLKRHLS